ncbi:MAG TPA: hydrogenase maturation protease [Bacteroidales bacterium]|nr:hydrogenase maturation protease [Bacteroidales bacterium]HOK73951.1 hydrogenase maturation protease [Bacteroidales bacterium]HOM39538.1 hydrogenase maturation protease [Bacteroidales bacterium]HOU31108.1 hydrogenase maturation protease [Bacteroidales bacterium]HPP91920.1 hydrogenase maturation protease [Bacteroidales bacterium]
MVKNKKTLVLGIGNTILSDDGIGPKIIRDLSLVFDDNNISFKEACCGGIEIAELISGYDCVVFIDAIHTGEGKPGDVYFFDISDFRETIHLSNVHDLSFITAIELAKSLGMDLPASIIIVGVEILTDSEFGEELSPPLKERYETILEEVKTFVKGLV